MKKTSSFFEDNQPLWVQKLPVQRAIDKECILSKKSKKTGLWKARKYQLSQNFLIKQNADKEPKSLNLENVVLEKVKFSEKGDIQQKFGFRLIRNQGVQEFYVKNEETLDDLYTYLRSYGIQTTFHENYSLGKKIGQGNFAKVYIAKCLKDSQDYAVKVFQKSCFKNVDIDKPALIKEIQLLRKVNHPGVIKLYEVYENENYIYLVKELLKGGELFQKLKKHTGYSEKYAAQVILRILSALDYIHSKNILHRDIKPENLILRSRANDYDICLADFGLADYYDPEGNYMFKRCGTPGYVAPELLQDKIYNNKIDIFSCGTIMFLILSGYQTFRGANYDEVVIKNYNCEIDYLDLDKRLSPSAYSLLRGLLHKHPKSRPSAKEAMKHEWFDKVLGKEEVTTTLRMYSELIPFTPEENKDLYSKTPVMGQGSIPSSPAMSTPSNSMTPLQIRSGSSSLSRSASSTVTSLATGKSFSSTPKQGQVCSPQNRQYGMHAILEEEDQYNVIFSNDQEECQIQQMAKYQMINKVKKANETFKLPSIQTPKTPQKAIDLAQGHSPNPYQKTVAKNVRANLKALQ